MNLAVKENYVSGDGVTAAQLNTVGDETNTNTENLDVVQPNLNEALVDIIQLQADATITPSTHSASIADIFTDSDGYANTIASATASFLTSAFGTGATDVNSYTAGIGADSGEVANGDFATGDLTSWSDTSTETGTAAVNSNACDLFSGGDPWTAGSKGEITQSVDVTGVSWIQIAITNFSDAGTGNNTIKIGTNTLLLTGDGTKTIYCGNLTGSQNLICVSQNPSGGSGQTAAMTVDDIIAYDPATDDYTQTASLVSSNPTDITDVWLTVKNNDNTFDTGTYDVSSDGGANYTTGVAFNTKVNIPTNQGDELKIKIIATTSLHKAYSVAWWD